MRDQWNNFWGDLLHFIPDFLLFLLILIVGFLVSRFVLETATAAFVRRAGSNRFFQRGVDAAPGGVARNVLGIVPNIVFWLGMLFTFYFAFGVFGPNPFYALFAAIVAFLPKAFVAVVLIVIAASVAGVVRNLIRGALSSLSYGNIVANVVAGFILVFGIIAALAQVGIAVAVILPLLYFFLFTLAGILIVGFGGAAAIVLRPTVARFVGTVEDEVGNVNEVVSDNTPSDPEMPVVGLGGSMPVGVYNPQPERTSTSLRRQVDGSTPVASSNEPALKVNRIGNDGNLM